MNEKENKLKLRENEVVHCETFMLAAQVCELADKLGCMWIDGTKYSDRLRYGHCGNKTYYNLNVGSHGSVTSITNHSGRYTIITAIEWLNRHGIFVYGQEVDVGCGGNRIYIAPHICVMAADKEDFRRHNPFRIIRRGNIKSHFPAWPVEPVKRRIKLDLEVTQEQYDAIKASLGEA